MGELNAFVLKQFGLSAGKVVREKAYFIAETPEGPRMVCKTQESAERIRFQYALSEYLIHAGYPYSDRFYPAPSGEPFVIVGGERYIMIPYEKRRAAEFNSWEDIKRILDAVARWHSLARGIPFHIIIEKKPPSLIDAYRKQLTELIATHKRVSRQARLSDFDVLFIKNAAYYTEQLRQSIKLLEKTAYLPLREKALAENHICHNLLKEETVSFSGDNVWIAQYTDAGPDVQLCDVCSLIRRYAQRTGLLAQPLYAVLDIYHRVLPIPPEERAVLQAMLLYPHFFLKTARQYYSKKRSWTPNALINRMHTVLTERDLYERYISNISPP
jgi:CotS family spore coat protein